MAGAERLVVALLGAGSSRRFGEDDKLAAQFHGRPLIEWAALAGRTIAADAHLVVTGPDQSPDLTALGYARIVNPEANEGLGTSIRCAARHARALGAGALMILLGDMPLVSPAHLARLVDAFAQAPARPVFSRTASGRMQPPVIFPAAALPALSQITGDHGAHDLAHGAASVPIADDELADVDTLADLERLATLASNRFEC